MNLTQRLDHRFAVITLGALLAAFAALTSAQEIHQYRATDLVNPEDIARILGGADEITPTRMPKMRSLRLLGPAAPSTNAAAAIEGSSIEYASSRPQAFALPVQFAFDSATILAPARPQLDALATGIKMLPPDRLVMIEGHTDAVGSDAYNLQLSARRASAVKTYLVRVHGINSDRLATEGFGKFRPINPDDSRAPENRRVQFRGS